MIRERIINLLNEPFPSHETVGSSLLSNLMVGIFIGVFLYIFMPFGLEQEAPNIAKLSIGFGMVTFLAASSFDLFCRFVLKLRLDLPSWAFWKWIVQCLLIIAWIAIGNILFVEWYYPGPQLSFQMWLNMLPGTLILGFFPIVVSGLVIQIKSARHYAAEASSMSDLTTKAERTPIKLALNANESIKFNSDELLFAESMQNYVSLAILQKGTLSRSIIRKPLKDTLKQLHNMGITSLFRCHRSFIVNLDNVSSVGGNAQGLKLSFANSQEIVPVSRSYISQIKTRLAEKAR